MNLRTFIASWRSTITVAEMTLRQTVMDSFIIFTVLLQPLIIALLALWMLRDKGSEYAMFIVVGSGLTGLWSSLLFVSGNSINMERWSGTLETLVGVPTRLETIVFGKNLANVAQSTISMIGSYYSHVYPYYQLKSQKTTYIYRRIVVITVKQDKSLTRTGETNTAL